MRWGGMWQISHVGFKTNGKDGGGEEKSFIQLPTQSSMAGLGGQGVVPGGGDGTGRGGGCAVGGGAGK